MTLAVLPALGTDLYLPALPSIQKEWGVGHTEAGLTLSLFYVVFSIFLLVYGPISDRRGRRPVLFVGLFAFMGGSFCSAAAGSLEVMIAGRMIQGVGAAGAAGLTLALTKDFYEGNERQKIMAYLGVAIPLCPMIAPLLGAFFLQYMSWRLIFITQGLFTFLPLYGTWRMAEPTTKVIEKSEHKIYVGLQEAMSRYWRLFRNTPYILSAIGFSIMTLPFYAYLGASADIYISGFHVSPTVFGLFFGLNAVALMGGAYLCAKVASKLSAQLVMRYSMSGLGIAALCMIATQGSTIIRFAVCMFMLSFFLGFTRPLGNFITLEAVRRDVGTASSLLSFLMSFFGSAGMFLVSLNWNSKPLIIGCMAVIGTITPAIMQFTLSRLNSPSREKIPSE